jgi:hypothetical protein
LLSHSHFAHVPWWFGLCRDRRPRPSWNWIEGSGR